MNMLEVLYRIYEVPSEEEKERNRELDNSFGFYSSTSKAENNELLMDCILCESRDQFKEIIKSAYGDNIGFRYSKKLKEGDLYCIIIGEHAYNAERYFSKVEYECSCCGNKVSTVLGYDVRFENYTLSNYLYNGEEYKRMRFCSNRFLPFVPRGQVWKLPVPANQYNRNFLRECLEELNKQLVLRFTHLKTLHGLETYLQCLHAYILFIAIFPPARRFTTVHTNADRFQQLDFPVVIQKQMVSVTFPAVRNLVIIRYRLP